MTTLTGNITATFIMPDGSSLPVESALYSTLVLYYATSRFQQLIADQLVSQPLLDTISNHFTGWVCDAAVFEQQLFPLSSCVITCNSISATYPTIDTCELLIVCTITV